MQLKYVKMSDEQIGEQFWKRLVNVCCTVPVHDNFYLSWWLRGKRETSNPDYNPNYLKKSSFEKLKVCPVQCRATIHAHIFCPHAHTLHYHSILSCIQHLVHRVRIVTSSLESYFQDGDVSFSKVCGLSRWWEWHTEVVEVC